MTNRAAQPPTIRVLRHKRPVSDMTILREIVKYSNPHVGEPPQLDEFERHHCSGSITVEAPQKRESIARALRVEEVSLRFRPIEDPIVMSGGSTREIIESILPPGLDKQDKESIVLALGHIVADDIAVWGRDEVIPQGTDWLAASLLTIHRVARFCSENVNWLRHLWEHHLNQTRKTALTMLLMELREAPSREDTIEILEQHRRAIAEVSPLDRTAAQDIPEWVEIVRQTPVKRPLPTSVVRALRKRIQAAAGGGWRRRRWPTLTIRADMLAPNRYQDLLDRLRADICVLRNRDVYAICEYLLNIRQPGHPTLADMREMLGVSKTGAKGLYTMLALTMVERYVPNLPVLGLRYRILVSPGRRAQLPDRGLAYSFGIGSSRRRMTFHLEPISSSGPQSLPNRTLQILADEETVSFSLALFNKSEGWWRTPWAQGGRLPRKKGVATITTLPTGEEVVRPTNRDVDLMSLLWASHNLRLKRQWLIRTLGYPERTLRLSQSKILRHRLMLLMYHPTVEFAGLSDGIVVVASNMRRGDARRVAEWLGRLAPLSRVLTISRRSDLPGGVAAELWFPAGTSPIAAGAIRERLSRTSGTSVVDNIVRYDSFLLTAMHRIFDRRRGWIDPWTRTP